MKVDYKPVGNVTVSGRAILAGVAATALLVGGGVALYEISWGVKSSNTDRASQINRQSLGSQEVKRDEINRKMTDLASLRSLDKAPGTTDDQLAANKAQEQAVMNLICADYGDLTVSYRQTMDTDLLATLGQMCNVNR